MGDIVPETIERNNKQLTRGYSPAGTMRWVDTQMLSSPVEIFVLRIVTLNESTGSSLGGRGRKCGAQREGNN